MSKSVKKSLPLALAVLLALSGAISATPESPGDNANVVISLSQDTFSGVGAGESFNLTISAAGVVEFKQLEIVLNFSPAGAFNLDALAFAPGAATPISPGISTVDEDTRSGGGANFSGGFTGDTDLGVFTVVMADGYDGGEATVEIERVQIGKTSSDYDWVGSGLTITINPPAPPPVITSIDPAQGPTAGGTAVTITGENFQDGATVTIGGAAAAATFVDANSLSATSPAGSVGAADVVVTNPDQSSATSAGAFSYLPPVITSIVPEEGPTAGGTLVTITGENFQDGATVTFGGVAAETTFIDVTSLTAILPAGAVGSVGVVVTNPDGSSATKADAFGYLPPVITAVVPVSGSVAGGALVTITGQNFQDGATVTFGGTEAEATFVDATTLTAILPAGAEGTVDVVVTNPDGTSATKADAFQYLAAPVVSTIDPASALTTGGTEVLITGQNFLEGATVTFGGTAAEVVNVVDANNLIVIIPAGEEGIAAVVVTNIDGSSGSLTKTFTYLLIEPALIAGSDTDASVDFSNPGSGDTEDGSDGEVEFSVDFSGFGDGEATITWAVTNHGSETVYMVDANTIEILAGTTETVSYQTDGGSDYIILDSEGDRSAGTTSVTATASTTAENSEGVSRELSVVFSATWDVPVAAELASITGEFTLDHEVFLQWAVSSQSNNLGWEVHRSIDRIHFEPVGDLVPGDGTADAFRTYNFMDNNLPQADVLYYYLKQLDLDGTSARSDIIEVVLSPASLQLPTANTLWQNFPNPFNPETIISFDLLEDSVVSLVIYDVAGQVVQTLTRAQEMRAGHHQLVWNGLDLNGAKVSSGVYFYQLKSNNFTSMKKMTLIQ